MRRSCLSISLAFFLSFRNQFVAAQGSSAITAAWQFPDQDGLTINYIDTIVLQWISNYDQAWMNLWCQNGTTGNNVVLGSQNKVQPSGSFPYILFTQDPNQSNFPVACHAQLAVEANGDGVDSPFGITFTSQPGVKAKTFSSSASSSTSTIATTSSSLSQIAQSELPSKSTTTSLSSSTSTSTASNIPTASSPVVAGGKEGMSSGVKAAIGVGSAALGLALIGLLIWLVWRHRKGAKAKNEIDKPEDKEDPAASRYRKYELEDEARRIHELSGNPAAHELDGDRKSRCELP